MSVCPRRAAAAALRHLADEVRDSAPVYARLAAAAGADPVGPALLAALPRDRWAGGTHLVNAMQFVGARDAVLRGALAGVPHGFTVARFLRRRRGCLLRVMRSRRSQVNDVSVAPVVRWLWQAAAADAPGIAVLDLGAGAALLTEADRYPCRYRPPTGPAWELPGTPGRPVVELAVNARVRPGNDPPVLWRAAVDPMTAPRTGDDRRWLTACLPVDHAERRALLRAALAHRAALAQPAARPPWLYRADAVRAVGDLAAMAPAHALLVVQTVGLLHHLTHVERIVLAARMLAAARHRPVAWVAVEPDHDAVGQFAAALGDPALAVLCERLPAPHPVAVAVTVWHGRARTVAAGSSPRAPRALVVV